MVYVVNLMECKLSFFMGVMTSKSETVMWAPRVAAVNGGCCS